MAAIAEAKNPSRRTVVAMAALGTVLAALLYSLDMPSYRHELSAAVFGLTYLAASGSRAFGNRIRAASLLRGTVTLMLCVIEVYLTLSSPTSRTAEVDQTFSGTLSQTHATLGYAPPTSEQVHVTRTAADQPDDVIYDVTYSLDEYARRTVPSAPTDRDCVLFFGGSFTWGEGVDDAETMPHQFSVASGDTVRAINFGFAGYGPNHMLRAIEDGALGGACAQETRAAVYTAIPVHYLRSAGLVDWGPKSPRYELTETSGAVSFTGPLFDTMIDFVEFQSKRDSALIKSIWNLAATPEALSLNAAIIRASADRIANDLGVPFFVLYWDLVDGGTDVQLNSIVNADFTVILVSELLRRDQMTTLRIPGDGHPNAEAYRLLGHTLFETLQSRIPNPTVSEVIP